MLRITPAVVALAAVLAFSSSVAAQNPASGDIGLGKRLYQDKATCGFCHGWSGDGAGDPQSPGKAANLRESKLDHDQLVEIIRCGVPGGTAMPHFDKFAWTKGEECFGMTEADARHKYGKVDIYRAVFRPMKSTFYGGSDRMLMKLIVEAATDKLLGCHIVGPDAPEMIQMAAIALKMGATKAQWDSTCAVHPTAAEELVTMREKYVPSELGGMVS